MNLFIINEYNRATSYGIGVYTNELINALSNTSNIIINYVILSSIEKEFYIKKINNNYLIWNIPQHANYRGNTDAYDLSVMKLFQLYIKDQSNLVFHFNFLNRLYLIKNLKDFFACKIVVCIHYLHWCFQLNGNSKQLKTLLKKKQLNQKEKKIFEIFEKEKKIFNISDKIICLSNHTHSVLINTYLIPKEKITIINNGLKDWRQDINKQQKIDIKKEYYINPKEKIILFVGRLDEIKGLDIIINAFREVLKKDSNCRLIIAGDGIFKTYIESTTGMWVKITFVGRVEKNELNKLYNIADIGIMASKHEQCSYSAIEMMMHGIPLVATSSPGLMEMIEDNKSGILVPTIENVVSHENLADKILFLMKNPQIRMKMKLSSRKRYIEYYSIEKMKLNINNFYSKLT